MEIHVHPGSSRLLKLLTTILLLIAIFKGYGSLFGNADVVTVPEPTTNPTGTTINATRPGPATQGTNQLNSPALNEIVLQLIAPAPGTVTKNPVVFKWQSAPAVYYLVDIRHKEAEKNYNKSSPWVLGGTYEINLPNEAIGNLEWRLVATADPTSSRRVESEWRHFTFDPFHENKERQDAGSD